MSLQKGSNQIIVINQGDKFIGSVDGTVFEVIELRASRADVGLKPDYSLSYGVGKIVHATESLLCWLIKSGGLLKKKDVYSYE